MTFTTTEQSGVTVIALDGNLMGGPDASALNAKLHALVEAGTRYVVIDMARVEFMNSSGLGLLIGGLTTMTNAGGTLRVANTSTKIAALFKITKLSSLFQSYDSVADAVASFRK